MRVTKGNIAAGIVTITPERQREIECDILNYRVAVGILKTMKDTGKISDTTYRKGIKEVGKVFGFNKGSIFLETA